MTLLSWRYFTAQRWLESIQNATSDQVFTFHASLVVVNIKWRSCKDSLLHVLLSANWWGLQGRNSVTDFSRASESISVRTIKGNLLRGVWHGGKILAEGIIWRTSREVAAATNVEYLRYGWVCWWSFVPDCTLDLIKTKLWLSWLRASINRSVFRSICTKWRLLDEWDSFSISATCWWCGGRVGRW